MFKNLCENPLHPLSFCNSCLFVILRACFKKLPRILSFNTMRYTFNMVTMMKEKVNTHFSFPLRLDMTPYTEDFLMGKNDRKEGLLLKWIQQALAPCVIHSVFICDSVYRTEASKIRNYFNQ